MKLSTVSHMSNSRVYDRPGSSYQKGIDNLYSKQESPFRRSVDQFGKVLGSKKASDCGRLTGVNHDPRAINFNTINQNLGEYTLLKEKIDVLKKKYN